MNRNFLTQYTNDIRIAQETKFKLMTSLALTKYFTHFFKGSKQWYGKVNFTFQVVASHYRYILLINASFDPYAPLTIMYVCHLGCSWKDRGHAQWQKRYQFEMKSNLSSNHWSLILKVINKIAIHLSPCSRDTVYIDFIMCFYSKRKEKIWD